jgi:hypothetical protein
MVAHQNLLHRCPQSNIAGRMIKVFKEILSKGDEASNLWPQGS